MIIQFIIQRDGCHCDHYSLPSTGNDTATVTNTLQGLLHKQYQTASKQQLREWDYNSLPIRKKRSILVTRSFLTLLVFIFEYLLAGISERVALSEFVQRSAVRSPVLAGGGAGGAGRGGPGLRGGDHPPRGGVQQRPARLGRPLPSAVTTLNISQNML